MQSIALKKRGKCLSINYINSKTKLLWECEEGHQWESLPADTKQGKWCRKCDIKSRIGVKRSEETKRKMSEAARHRGPGKSRKPLKEPIIEEAKKYCCVSDWRKASISTYQAASRHGYLTECTSHMKRLHKPNGYWTKERLIEDASNYKTKPDWKRGSPSAYVLAKSQGLFPDCCSHMEKLREVNGYWTKERCEDSAKKYSTIGEWKENDSRAISAAFEFKDKVWYGGITAHMSRVVSHGELTIYSFFLRHGIPFVCQKKFKGLVFKQQLPYDFYLDQFNLIIEYQGEQHLGTSKNSLWQDEHRFIKDEIKKQYAEENGFNYLTIYDTKTKDIEDILKNKISELTNASFSFHERELTPEEKKKLLKLNIWTKEAVLVEAKKYSDSVEWSNCGNASRNVAYRNGWFSEASLHMTNEGKLRRYWTKELIIKEARNYETIADWRRFGNNRAYQLALANGWSEEATKHMKKHVARSRVAGYWTKERVLESIKGFQNKSRWMNYYGGAYNRALKERWMAEVDLFFRKWKR